LPSRPVSGGRNSAYRKKYLINIDERKRQPEHLPFPDRGSTDSNRRFLPDKKAGAVFFSKPAPVELAAIPLPPSYEFLRRHG
jgi:hypothetical protein